MKKVLILGDSHVFRLIEAQKNHKTSQYKFDFVAAIGQVINMLIIKDDQLQLKQPDIKWPKKNQQMKAKKFQRWYEQCLEQINNIEQLSHYDSIIVFGCGLVDGSWHQFDLKKSYSTKFMNDYMLEMISHKTHYQIINALNRSGTAAKLFSIPTPLVNEVLFSPEHIETLKLLSDRKALPNASFKEVIPLYRRVLKSINSELLPLPDCIYNSNFNATASSFKISSRNDFGHLNAAGADIVFSAINETLDAYS